jgi:preprotein translocase subunit SecE
MAVAKSEKPNVFAKIKRYFRNMFQEMKKVHWPDKRTLLIYTAVVIGVSLVIALFILLLDTIISFLMGLIL